MSAKAREILILVICILLLFGAVLFLMYGHPYWGIIFLIAAGAVVAIDMLRSHEKKAETKQ